jgi:hypothetical protein
LCKTEKRDRKIHKKHVETQNIARQINIKNTENFLAVFAPLFCIKKQFFDFSGPISLTFRNRPFIVVDRKCGPAFAPRYRKRCCLTARAVLSRSDYEAPGPGKAVFRSGGEAVPPLPGSAEIASHD